jgi:uncharacterized protein YjaZ
MRATSTTTNRSGFFVSTFRLSSYSKGKGASYVHIINTKKWLKNYIEALGNRSLFSSSKQLQNDHVAIHLQEFFPGVNPYDILNYLHSHGFSKTTNSDELKKYVTFIEKNKIERFVATQLKRLQNEWKGPDVKVLLLPIDSENRELLKELGNKSGIGFKDKIVIFLNEKVTKKGLKAVITHEYHHVCRLKACKKEMEDFTLLDSLLIEGLAELAVEEYVGPMQLATWCGKYQQEELDHYWHEIMKPNLTIVGKENHHTLLYGEVSGLPKWIGYSIGYAIVKSIVSKHKHLKTKRLLPIPSEKLLDISSYDRK